MSIISPSNIEYIGSKPNFTRDSYDTLEEMQEALEAGHIDEGHQTYCLETGITYKAIRSDGALVWKDIIGDLRSDLIERIQESEDTTSGTLSDLSAKVEELWNWYQSMINA